jgi:hypothetical protein
MGISYLFKTEAKNLTGGGDWELENMILKHIHALKSGV